MKSRPVQAPARNKAHPADEKQAHSLQSQTQKPLIEVSSFNGRMRDEVLNETLFRNLAHARDLIAAWVTDYNTQRPHSALGYQTPAGYALNLTTAIARPAARDERSAQKAIAQPAPNGVNTNRKQLTAG